VERRETHPIGDVEQQAAQFNASRKNGPRVDLLAIVSKYIGETEKNLRKLSAAAERANIILLLDEADALIGKRTEVKDARDRYANLDTAHLLQSLEEFAGVVFLATTGKPATARPPTSFPRRCEIHTAQDWLSREAPTSFISMGPSQSAWADVALTGRVMPERENTCP